MIDTTRDSAAPSVCLITMGCAKNEVDSAAMARRLREAGFSVTEEASSADAIIVNTCSFIQAATEESIDAIFEAASLPKVDEGSAVLIVAGCMPARYGDDLAAELTEASAFVPCSREDDIAEVVARALRISLPVAAVGGEPAEGEGRTFAYVKISDGCDRFCSYCTIPYIRGRYHSFPYEQIAEDVEREIASGAREIVLIAQDTGRWGADLPDGRDLAWLVDTLAEAHPDTWFRIMYLQPEGATDELLSVMAARENVCSYLDIPLQHVSKPILRAMNRRGDAAAFRALIERIEAAVPDITLRTTLIAGFPAKPTSSSRSSSISSPRGCSITSASSPTPARRAPPPSTCRTRSTRTRRPSRAQVLRDAADAACGPRIAERIGKGAIVLVEGTEEDGQRFGRAQCQAPEVDGVTYVSRGEIGAFVPCTIADTLLYEMEGE